MKPSIQKQIKKTLSKNTAYYVLITCDAPNSEGNMNVEMSFEGDVSVASFLLEGAQSFVNDEIECQINTALPKKGKILPLRQ